MKDVKGYANKIDYRIISCGMLYLQITRSSYGNEITMILRAGVYLITPVVKPKDGFLKSIYFDNKKEPLYGL